MGRPFGRFCTHRAPDHPGHDAGTVLPSVSSSGMVARYYPRRDRWSASSALLQAFEEVLGFVVSY